MIHQLREEGLSISAIAWRVGLDRKTVRKYLKTGLTAPSGPRTPRVQLLDPYRSYLRERVTAYPGLRGTRLSREIRALCYPGGYSQLTAYLRTVCPPLQPGFEHRFETGGLRRVQVRGQENIRKRLLVHAAAFKLELLRCHRHGVGTPRSLQERATSRISVPVSRPGAPCPPPIVDYRHPAAGETNLATKRRACEPEPRYERHRLTTYICHGLLGALRRRIENGRSEIFAS